MIKILVTLSANNVIGIRREPGLLWDSEVNNKFLQTSMEGENLVMGNGTFKNLNRSTINGKIIVLSKTETPGERDGAHYYNNSIDIIKEYENFVVIGGEQTYHTFLPVADMINISMIGVEVEEEDNIYFPLDTMEDSFYGVEESGILKDMEKISGKQIKIIFSRWVRRIKQKH